MRGLMCIAGILLCERTTGGGMERDTPAASSHVGSGQAENINNFYSNLRTGFNSFGGAVDGVLETHH